MNSRKNPRLAWLAFCLAIMAMLMTAVNVGLMTWTLRNAQPPPLRIADQDKQLDQLIFAGESHIRQTLDETAAPPIDYAAMNDLAQYLDNPHRNPDAAAKLSELDSNCTAWRGNWNVVWDDLSQQRTMSNVRGLISKLIGAADELEGRHRLENAVHYRQWLTAAGEDAYVLARQILTGEAREQSQDFVNLGNELRNLAILAEAINGQPQPDALANLKDNQIRPALERLGESINTLGLDATNHDALTPQAIRDLGAALFGRGYSIDDAQQTIRVGAGGLYNLRASELQLIHRRDDLLRQSSELFQGLQRSPITFAQMPHPAVLTLAREIQYDITRNQRAISICGGAGLGVFALLAIAILLGVRRQMAGIRRAGAAELEKAAQQIQQMNQRSDAADSAAVMAGALGPLISSITTSTTVIRDGVAQSRVGNFAKAAAMIEAHRADIAEFLTVHEKGKQLPAYFTILARQLSQEHDAILHELNNLMRGMEQITQVVSQKQPTDHPAPTTKAA